MPDMTNIEQLQAQLAQETHSVSKLDVVRHALLVLDPQFHYTHENYLTLLYHLRDAVEAEINTLAAPPKGS
jgi:hypothetical protein